jgi:transcriptional regulator with XRE-family HTH domain
VEVMLLREVIGENLKAERISQNRTLRDVSASAFMSLGYLSELERGLKEVSSEMLDPICKALNISVPELLIRTATDMELFDRVEASLSYV